MNWLRQAARVVATIALWLGFAGTALAFENELNGTWVGTHCSGGQTTFRFSTRDQAHVWAGEHWCSAQTCGDVDYRFSDFQREAHRFSIRAFRGSAFQALSFSIDFTLSSDGQTLTGVYNGHPMCSEITLHRQSESFAGGPYDRSTPQPLPNSDAQFAALEADRASEVRENEIGRRQDREARAAAERAAAERAAAERAAAERAAAERARASERSSGDGGSASSGGSSSGGGRQSPPPSDSLTVAQFAEHLPADLRPPARRRGAARPGLLPADPDRSHFYANCSAGFRGLEQIARDSGGALQIGTGSLSAQELHTAAQDMFRLARLTAENPDTADYLSEPVMAANQRAMPLRFNNNATLLAGYAWVCLDYSAEDRGAAGRL